MKAISFQKLLDGITSRAGIDPTLPENSLRTAMIADVLDDALADAWTFYPWPDAVRTEQRVPTGSPAKLIYFVATNKTTIGDVLRVFREDPSDNPAAREWNFTQSDSRAEITDSGYSAGDAVWVQFRVPVPRLTISAWSPTMSYIAGDIVFHKGDCYMAKAPVVVTQGGQEVLASSGKPIAQTVAQLEPPNINAWDKQEIPEFLGEYLKAKALAALLYTDGQDQRAALQEERAENALVKAMDDFWLRRGRVHRWTALTNQYQ